jgi:putative ABC transport system ATP-binding protein
LRTTTVIVTHNAGIAGMADRVIVMGSGEIVQIKRNEVKITPEELEW